MTLEQIKMFRESYTKEVKGLDGRSYTNGAYIKFCLDGGIDLVTSKDLVIYDDDNTMLHAVCLNEDMRSQGKCPIKIISAEYEIVQQVETIMNQSNFEAFLDEGYMSGLISDEKKAAMIKWTRAIHNQDQKPIDEVYFKDGEPVFKSDIKNDEEDASNEDNNADKKNDSENTTDNEGSAGSDGKETESTGDENTTDPDNKNEDNNSEGNG